MFYIGTYPTEELLEKITKMVAVEKGIITDNEMRFPIIKKSGINDSSQSRRKIGEPAY